MKEQPNDVVLFVVVLGVLIMISIPGLLLAYATVDSSNEQIEMSDIEKIDLRDVVPPGVCTENGSCTTCIRQESEMTCIQGRCNARGICVI